MKLKCVDTLFRFIGILLIVTGMMAGLFSGCTDRKSINEGAYLIKVGNSVVTVLDFKNALEIAKTAYPHNTLQDLDAVRAIELRLLEQLTEEAILLEKARKLNISISDEDIEKEVLKLKKDYPDDVFEQALLENAVSYHSWKNRLKNRMIIEKVVNVDLIENISITPEEIRKYYEEYHKNKSIRPESTREQEELIIKRLRRKKAEEMYEGWIKNIQNECDVDINQEQWNKIVES